MKKQYYLLAVVAFMAFIVMPTIIKAQIDSNLTNKSLKALPEKARQEMLSEFKERQDNAKINQNLRNTKLIDRGYVNNGRAMLANIFEMRKHIIVNELQKALNNLKNVSSRLQSRIDKTASSTRDMTNAKALLVTANAKILTAQITVDAIINLSATSTASLTATSTASTTVDLNKPRLVAGTAQKAIKEAQKALNDVVVAIAKAMGLQFGRDIHQPNATTTATTTNTTGTSTD